jgi:hypothetical protein
LPIGASARDRGSYGREKPGTKAQRRMTSKIAADAANRRSDKSRKDRNGDTFGGHDKNNPETAETRNR